MHNNKFSPIKWSAYFENQKVVTVQRDKFNVYTSGSGEPVLVLIHGAGYSAVTWSLFVKSISTEIDCQVCAVDLRGHGNTKTEDEMNLSLDILVADVAALIESLFDETTPIVLIGHSLGGSVAVSVAPLFSNVIGMCVIDVVEGTAIEALCYAKSILGKRPNTFQSVEDAIRWCYESGQTHNLESARVSMPGQIIGGSKCNANNGRTFGKSIYYTRDLTIMEEDEENSNQNPTEDSKMKTDIRVLQPNNPYTWRIDLLKTEQFWDGWFTGLSQKFVNVQVPKILILANINRLDTALTVAQMQGRFQLQILPRSGHAVHESQPEQVATVIAKFLKTQKLVNCKNKV